MSKKLTVTMLVIQALAHLSQDEPNKIYYGCLIAVVGIIYKLAQMRIDVIKTKYGVVEPKADETIIKEKADE